MCDVAQGGYYSALRFFLKLKQIIYMSDFLITPTQKPKCLTGCAHFVLIEGLNGNKHPRCMAVQMPLLMNGNQLIIDVAKCPVFLSIEEAQKIVNEKTETT